MSTQATPGPSAPGTGHSAANCPEADAPERSTGKVRKADRRIAKTKEALLHALVEVLIEKGYESCSVADIVERANVGRSTFYAHYADKEDLLQESLRGLKMYLIEASTVNAQSEQALHPALAFVRPLLDHLHEMRVLFRALASRPSDSAVQRQLHLMLSELVRERLTVTRGDLPAASELVAEWVVGSLLAVCFWWMNGHDELSPADVERACLELLSSALRTY